MDALLTGATKLITPPAAEPVSLADAKAHLRVDHSADDTLIEGLIVAARQHVENVTWRALVTQTWELSLAAWPGQGRIELPCPPLQSVTWVKTTDDAGAVTTLDSSLYRVDTYATPGAVLPTARGPWPSFSPAAVNPIVVRYVAGYGAAADVPALLKMAVKLLVGHWYENREATVVAAGTVATELPLAVESILTQYMVR